LSVSGSMDRIVPIPWDGELDPVTDLPPRKALDETLPILLRLMGQEKLPLSSLMIDIDHFKNFNDKWGHETGDRVLNHVARIIRNAVLYRGEAYRYGGEEITVLLPNSESAEAMETAERIRTLVFGSPLENLRRLDEGDSRVPLSVSISIGVSSFPAVEGSELLVAADQALYQAKEEGRNKVCAYSANVKKQDEKVILEVSFPAASSVSEGTYVILARWFRHRGEMTEIEAREISHPGKGIREFAEGRAPDCGYITAEIKGRVTYVERRVDKTFFGFEVEPETLDLMFKHLQEKGI
jgi:diguanylate cyclase (GGDEF)-like protein